MVSHRESAELHHPLELLVCKDCTLAQLSVIVEPDIVFPPDYPYSSGNSQALHDNFADLASRVKVKPDDLVVDIGANDGTLLSKFDGCRTVGVEPTCQAEKIQGQSYRQFFSEKLAERIVEQHGRASVITACNVLAHVEDLDDVMRGIAKLLAPDGILIAENHDLASVVDGGQWDTVYHEHLRFFDPHSFNALLERHGFGTAGIRKIDTHGGSFRTIAARGKLCVPPKRDYDWDTLAWDAKQARGALRRYTSEWPAWGIGATARATTIINYCGFDVEDIPCVCEVAGSDKIGRYIPGTRIPVVDEAELFSYQPTRAVLFSWHLADLITPKLRERGFHGDIWVPLPVLHAADGLAVAA
jgi:SAM-dependent methyltransferase